MDNWLAEHRPKISSKPSDLQSKIESYNYESALTKYRLTKEEMTQIKSYMIIYSSNNFNTQKMTNNFITENNRWNEFPDIRSLNNHGQHTNIPGILPKFYRITCSILDIIEGGGAKLTKATKY